MATSWKTILEEYYQHIEAPKIPKQYLCMNPYKNQETLDIVFRFLAQYYNDSNIRTVLFGINPGRLGSGLTGISFTDPVRLKNILKMDHSFEMRPELSSEFIYEVIDAWGGPSSFFSSFFLSAVYPLGFMHHEKNINYYEFENWQKHMLKPILKELKTHLKWPVNRTKAICVGQGENYKILNQINDELHLFDEIIPLPHPRWVLQYRRKSKQDYLDLYLKTLSDCLPPISS